jgi:hypothetical protein
VAIYLSFGYHLVLAIQKQNARDVRIERISVKVKVRRRVVWILETRAVPQVTNAGWRQDSISRA